MQKYNDKQIPLSHAWLWIFLWTLVISGSSWMGWLYYLHIKELRWQDPRYRVTRLLLCCPQKERLNASYLAELLDLSWDKPHHLYYFDVQAAKRKLLASPLIKEGSIKKMIPNTLAIDYQMRTPIAYLGDYENTAIDREGVLFPFAPFFKARELPTLYLGIGLAEPIWGQQIAHQERFQLVWSVLKNIHAICRQIHLVITKIDVSQAFADSYGQRQIILVLKESESLNREVHFHILRLNVEEYQQNLANYLVLRREWNNYHLPQPSTIIDFRIPHLAFIKKI